MARGQSGNNKRKKKASLSQTPSKDIEKKDSLAEYAEELSAPSRERSKIRKTRNEKS